MRPHLDDPPLRKHHDDIRVLDRAETMRHRDGRAPALGLLERRLHNLLRFGVQRGSCLIEEQEAGFADEGSRDGDTLALAAGELCAAAAAEGVEALCGRSVCRMVALRRITRLGERLHEVVNIGLFCCVFDLLVCGIVADTHGDVIADGTLV